MAAVRDQYCGYIAKMPESVINLIVGRPSPGSSERALYTKHLLPTRPMYVSSTVLRRHYHHVYKKICDRCTLTSGC
ncbi:hypothetical protein RR48_04585 [Papilio machaon]|uniref:Uncharacterized protein n=1 Tax=Papilio machaon TaxID=76193 RepID=A0A0N1INP8_PAPMA|nr:hypothetical protein RR48_04585 [Papilio machaon]